jgi:hypothetical protein
VDGGVRGKNLGSSAGGSLPHTTIRRAEYNLVWFSLVRQPGTATGPQQGVDKQVAGVDGALVDSKSTLANSERGAFAVSASCSN